MCSKPENTNKLESDSHGITSSTICSQPWWHGRFNAAPPGVLGDSTLKTSVEPLENGMANKTSKSQGDVINEADGVNKQMQSTVEQQSDGNYGPEQLQQVASTIPAAGSEYGAPHPQLELIGHSIGCAPYPYSDPYYGGLITAYGTQALVNPHIVGMPHTRMPLPLQMAEEPVYVNAKQYHGIIRRRESRAKAELERKLIKVRKPYLHESRHQHALRRARGCGGRFLNTKKQSDGTNATSEKGMDSEPKSSAMHASDGRQEVNGFIRQEMHEQYAHSNGDDKNNSSYQHHQGFRMSAYHSLPGERGDEGDCSGQQRGSISVNQARHRALAIQ